MSDPAPLGDPATYRARRDAAGHAWNSLAEALEPDPAALLKLLDELAWLEGAGAQLPWDRPAGPLPANVHDLLLADVDGDGRVEAVLLTRTGTAHAFRPDASWEPLAGGALPADAPPVRGLASAPPLHGGADLIQVVAGDGAAADRLYDVFYQPPDRLVLREALRSIRPAVRRLTVERRSGTPTVDGMHQVLTVADDGDFLHVAPLLSGGVQLPLDVRPTALTYTASTIFVADTRERIRRWSWREGTLVRDAGWEVAVDGQVSGLTLLPTDDAPLLVVATDERRLLVIDDTGDIVARHGTDTILRAVAPDLARGELLAVADEGDVRRYPLLPLEGQLAQGVTPLPGVAQVAARLPEDALQALLERWLSSDAPAETRAAVRLMLAGSELALPFTPTEMLATLDGRHSTARHFLETAEPLLLNVRRADDPRLQAIMTWAIQRSKSHDPSLQHRINRLTARLAARFPTQMGAQPEWQQLDDIRSHDDRRRARELTAGAGNEMELRAGLNIYARMLLEKREERWIFAATGAVRAIMPLPAPAQVLVATRDSQIYHMDLDRPEVTSIQQLADGAIPRAMAGDAAGSGAPGTILVTDHGQLFTVAAGSAAPEVIPNLDVSPADPRALALLPATAAQPARLFAGGRDGHVLAYRREPAGSWVPTTPLHLPAEMIHSVTPAAGDAGRAPLLLVGCGQQQRGALYQLALDGSTRHAPLTFAAPVLDAHAIRPRGAEERRLIVLTANGYLHAATPGGARLWLYRVGRAARNVAVYDINGDGQQEIIVGGRDRTVVVLDAEGTVLWNIPARAPVTYVATQVDREGQPLLLISDLENGLHVVGVNPPGSAREQALMEETEEALQRLARLEGRSATDLIARWVVEAPTPFLRGYAFHIYGERFHLEQANIRDLLLNAAVDDDELLVQRAYARALIRALVAAPPDGVPAAVLRRLLPLLERDTVGLAAMRALLHTGRLTPETFNRWLPLLHAASTVPDPAVQRAVLYVLRSLRPLVDGDLRPEAWDIVEAVLATRSDAHAWVARDAAALLRDLAGDDARLWTVAHRLLARLPESDLLERLGGTNPRLVDDFATANALAALDRLRRATTVDEAAAALSQISDSFTRRFPTATEIVAEGGEAPDGEPLISFYGALAEAARCRDEGEWRRFAGRRRQPEGMTYLRQVAQRVTHGDEPAGRTLSAHLSQVEEDIRSFLDAGSEQPEPLRRLIGQLRRESELLVTLPAQRDDERVLYRAVAGLLWTWVRPSGVLTGWFGEATRPAEPQLSVRQARLLRDKIELTLRLTNPSNTEQVEELSLFLAQATVRVGTMELRCRAESRQPTDGLTLAPRGEIQFRIQVPLSNDQRRRLDRMPEPAGRLDVPIQYFQPPRSWPSATLAILLEIQAAPTISVDWVHDLPVAWKNLSAAIEQARALNRAQDRVTPLLITTPPFARRTLSDQLQQAETTPASLIDLRQLVPVLRRAQRQDQTIDRSTLLAWLARNLWPDAPPEVVAQIETEGAPEHFFRAVSVQEQSGTPTLILLDNVEGLLFGLARLDTAVQAAVEDGLRFLDGWAREAKIELVLLSTLLGEQMARAMWPRFYAALTVIQADRPVKADGPLLAERIRLLDRLLDIHQLRETLRRFEPATDSAELVTLAGGYLHVLDLLVLPALQHLRDEPEVTPGEARTYLLNRANKQNFFNALWMWQSFYERLALVLLAYGEIPLEDRGWAEPGMVLSRDYFERTAGNRPEPEPALPAGAVLTQRDVVTIRANRAYRPGDIHIRGMSPRQPAVTAWGAGGELLLDLLLRAADGERILAAMEREGALRRRHDRTLGEYYELGLPLYEAWLHRHSVLEHILAAGNGQAAAAGSWYPPALAHDQREEGEALLFPGRPPGPARVDLPLTALPEIQPVLNSRTQPIFLQLYGLEPENGSGSERWQRLVSLGRALRAWSAREHAPEESARALFDKVSTVLGVRQEDSPPAVAQIPDPNGATVAAARGWLVSERGGGSKPILMLAIEDDAPLAAGERQLLSWVRQRLERAGATGNGSESRGPAVEHVTPRLFTRDIVLAVVHRGATALQRHLGGAGNSPSFIFLDPQQLGRLATEEAPAAALRDLALQQAGRLPFSPYQTDGSLRSAELFVGHEQLLNAILSRLPAENQLLLGGRGSGRTSLLNEIARRAPEAYGQDEIMRLVLHLRGEHSVGAFYARLRRQLERHGRVEAARALSAFPADDYGDLLETMRRLAAEVGQPLLILADDIDALFRHDRLENDGRFFAFLTDQLTGAPGRPCVMVASGAADLPLDGDGARRAIDSFGSRHTVLEVGAPAVRRLLAPLEALNVTVDEPDTVVELIVAGTGGVPRYVQAACAAMLSRLDREGGHVVGPADVRHELARAVDPLLKRELWDELPGGTPEERAQQQLLIAAAVLGVYGTQIASGTTPLTLPEAERHFDSEDARRYLAQHAPGLVPDVWEPKVDEVERQLRCLSKSIGVAPAPGEETGYHFPRNLLPDLLIRLHRRADTAFDLYAAVDGAVEQLRRSTKA